MIVLVLLVIGAGVLWMGGDKLAGKGERDTTETQQTFDRASRRQIWTATWHLFRHNLWTGTGFGAYFLAVPQFQSDSGRLRLEQAHNDYLDLAANGGVVGLLLALWFVAAVTWQGARSLASRKGYQRAAGLGAAAGLISIATHSFFDFGLQLTGIAVVCSALIVILAADVAPDLSERVKRRGSSRQLQNATSAFHLLSGS
jgi:O-antigen ligase